MRLMIFILNKTDLLNFLLEDLSKAGIKGATIVNSTEMGMVLSKQGESFIGNSIKALFDMNSDNNKTILAAIHEEQLDIVRQVIKDVVGDLSKPNTGILFTVPIDFVEGIIA